MRLLLRTAIMIFHLFFDFKNMDDLNAYQKHPMHVEFGKFITAIRESRACIDYEF